MVGQMYVEFQIPHEQRHKTPLIFVHGGQQGGMNWTQTADGREGWAQFFLRRGHATYVVDQVGRGRSAWREEFHGKLGALKTDFAIQRFVAPERFEKWPQAKLHTQWPGRGEPGDPIFDDFIATQLPSIADYAFSRRSTRRRCARFSTGLAKRSSSCIRRPARSAGSSRIAGRIS